MTELTERLLLAYLKQNSPSKFCEIEDGLSLDRWHFRVLDKMLQKLRKDGKIIFKGRAKGWGVR
jgi:hypothetical protein